MIQVFQTFSCKYLEELDKSYLWADFRIECYTPLHRRYMAYAAVMIAICEFQRYRGVSLACFFAWSEPLCQHIAREGCV